MSRVGQRRRVPLPIEEGCYMRHVNPGGEVTIWRLLLLEHGEHPEHHCKIQLLSSTKVERHMEVGESTCYQRDILEYYDLWDLISEEEAGFDVLGGLE